MHRSPKPRATLARRMVCRAAWTIALLGLLLPALTLAMDHGVPADANTVEGPDGVLIHRFDRTLSPRAPITEVRVSNDFGDVRVRGAKTNQVGVSVVAQQFGKQGAQPLVEVQSRGSRATVMIDYPDHRGRISDGAERPGRVDLVVFVPATATLVVGTDDGAIRVSHRSGRVQAQSRSGAISASTEGALDLRSASGNVLARQVGGVPAASRVRSASGAINMVLTAGGDQMLRVRAGAGIHLAPGWPDDVKMIDGTKRWQQRFGSARHRLLIESASGEVNLMPFISLEDLATEN